MNSAAEPLRSFQHRVQALLSASPLKSTSLCALVVLIACAAAYSNSLQNGFMLDDHLILFGEQGVEKFDSPGEVFTRTLGSFYRPVGHLVLVVSYGLFGSNQAGYHLINLGLFFLICMMFFLIAELLFHDRSLSLLTAVLYALHPINGMLVNYVTASIISTFVLTLEFSFAFFALWLNNRRRSLYAFSLLCFALGLLSHEMSLMFPVYLLCLLYFLKDFTLKRSLWTCLPFLSLSFVYFVVRLSVASIGGAFVNTFRTATPAFGSYVATVMDLLYWYVSKLVSMRGIIFLWSSEMVTDPSGLRMILAVGTLAGMGYLIFVRWKRGLHAFSLSLFISGLAPVTVASFMYPAYVDPLIEPHWFYFSSFGFFLIFSNLILSFTRNIRFVLGALLLSSFLVTGLLAVRDANTHWRTQETYCRYWLSLNQKNLTPFYGLGKALLEQGECREAIQFISKGIEVGQYSSAQIATDLGRAHFCTGNSEEAERAYQSAIKMNPKYSLAHHYRGILHLKQKAYWVAQLDFVNALRMNPRSATSYQYLLATRAESEGNIHLAMDDYREISALDPTDEFSRKQLIELVVQQQELERSEPSSQ